MPITAYTSKFRLPLQATPTALFKDRIGRRWSELFTMKSLLALSVACLFVVSAVKAETYPAEYDNLDVDALLSNEEKVKKFGRCLLDDAICSEKALKLKAILLDALQTKCSKCTETQKNHIRKAAKYYIKNSPEQWQKMVQKYDPEGKYAEGFKQFLQGS